MIEINKHYDEIEHNEKQPMSSSAKNAIKYGVGAAIILVGIVALVLLINNNSGSTPATESTTTVSQQTKDFEAELIALIEPTLSNCALDRSEGDSKRWTLSLAMLVCERDGNQRDVYALFGSNLDLDDTFVQQSQVLVDEVEKQGSVVRANISGSAPCSRQPNESGEWGNENGKGGKFICISEPEPKIVWTHNGTRILGEADINGGEMTDLIDWWTNEAGPR